MTDQSREDRPLPPEVQAFNKHLKLHPVPNMDCMEHDKAVFDSGWRIGMAYGRKQMKEEAAAWLQGSGQPGYATEIRSLED